MENIIDKPQRELLLAAARTINIIKIRSIDIHEAWKKMTTTWELQGPPEKNDLKFGQEQIKKLG